MKTVDPVTLEIIRHAFISIAEEMNAALVRTAYSPVIYEMRDSSVSLFDQSGQLLGQSSGLPIFLGNLEEAIRVVVGHVGEKALRPGDVYILNDSYLLGTHLPDVSVVTPIFHKEHLIGFTTSRAHWRDIGAKDPGSPVDTTEIYQEGLRLGPTRIVREGQWQEDILDILRRNSRAPELLSGDLYAQISAASVGEERLAELVERYGISLLGQAAAAIFDQCAEMDREAVRAIPDGRYKAEGFLDNDGVDDKPVRVRVTVTVHGAEMEIDLTGSSPQVRGSINCGRAQTISACRVAFKMLLNPNIPVTAGTFRPLAVRVPSGSIFDAQEPAACQYYFSPLGLLIDLVIKALAPAIPNGVVAAHFGDSMVVDFGRRGSAYFLMAEALAGGWGASAARDGENALINNVSGDLRNIPIEVVESKYPMRIPRFQLRPDSGGLGCFRGGLGVIRVYEVIEDAIFVTLHLGRSITPAWGLFGAEDGWVPTAWVQVDGQRHALPLRTNAYLLPRGAIVGVETGGGGGYGPPERRSPAAVNTDLSEGYATPVLYAKKSITEKD